MADVTITERAQLILRKGFETANLDPAAFGVRVRVVAGTARTSFADEPESADQVFESEGIRLFLEPKLSASDHVTIDATVEHETITVTAL